MDLSIEDLSVSLAGHRVLEGVRAVLKPGKVTAILGPNGSGKSTLVKSLAGLISPGAGAVRLGGDAVAALDPRERARAIGYLPQEASVHWSVSVRDLVTLGRIPHRAPFAGLSAEDLAAIDEALEATGAVQLAPRRADELSGGERARVLLARVLAGRPAWLLADEPLASLDPVHQLALLERLRALAAEGMGVVIVLHDLIQAARAADEVLLLREGRVVAFGPVRDALAAQPLRDTFGVEVMMVADAEGRLLPVPIGTSG